MESILMAIVLALVVVLVRSIKKASGESGSELGIFSYKESREPPAAAASKSKVRRA